MELEDHVVLTGYLTPKELSIQLAKADIGVSPYCGRAEFSGLKLLDYKAAGLATIASGENGQPAVIKHGQTGWIVPPCDDNAIYEAIIDLAENVRLRQQMGQQARLEAEKWHRWDHTAEKLDEVFNQILSQ